MLDVSWEGVKGQNGDLGGRQGSKSFPNTLTAPFFIPSESQKMLGNGNKSPVFV